MIILRNSDATDYAYYAEATRLCSAGRGLTGQEKRGADYATATTPRSAPGRSPAKNELSALSIEPLRRNSRGVVFL